MTATLDGPTARAWVDRWDAQQEEFMPDREERFTALIDAVAESAGRQHPLVLDLGCGPGSLAVRLIERIPGAVVVAVDLDPLLLGLGQAARTADVGRDQGSLSFVELDLRVPGWSASLGLDRPVDAAVSTTALHWLRPDALAAMYAEVATLLRPGGLLLNGDHLKEDEAVSPTLAKLGRALNVREEHRRAPQGRPETWAGWWDAVLADAALADLAAERERRLGKGDHHGSGSGRLAVHLDALRAAGFAEVGTLWQRGDNRLLCAVLARGDDPPEPPVSGRFRRRLPSSHTSLVSPGVAAPRRSGLARGGDPPEPPGVGAPARGATSGTSVGLAGVDI